MNRAVILRLLDRWSPRMLFEAIRRQLGRTVPFVRMIGIDVAVIGRERAETRMPADERLGNNFGSVHAGALFTLCEAASGALLAGAMVDVIMQTRFIVRDAQIEYLKPARGEVHARASLADDGASVLEALRRDGHVDVEVDVSAITRLSDGSETLVARASFNWQLELRRA
jgi:uncharacterized protein (TIGR00369 family)